MKIALFIDKWTSGGIETYLLYHLENMNLQGIECEIVTSTKLSTVYDERLSSLDINIIELLPGKKVSPLIRNFLLVSKFKKYIKNTKLDIIHFNIYNGISMLYCFLSKRYCDVRILHSHNSDIEPSKTRILKLAVHNLFKRIFSRSATEKWACSDLAGQWLFNKNDEFEYIKNGVDINKFKYDTEKRKQLRNELGISDSTILFGNIGRMNTQKNQNFLLDIIIALRKENRDIKLLLVGEGPLNEALRKKVSKFKLERNIIFYGVTDDVAKVLSGIDVFLLPSLFEGNPVSGVEAQVSGLPTLFSSTITRHAFLLDTSKAIQINDIKSWTAKVKSISPNNEKDREQAFQKVVNEGYSITDTGKYLEKKYRSLGKNED